MTKREYLEKLARGLRPLPKEERRRQLDDCEERIRRGLDKGQSEEEAVAAMDPPETVIDRVLREYAAAGKPPRRRRWPWVLLALGVFLLFYVFYLGPKVNEAVERRVQCDFPESLSTRDMLGGSSAASTSASTDLDRPYHAEYIVPADGVTELARIPDL